MRRGFEGWRVCNLNSLLTRRMNVHHQALAKCFHYKTRNALADRQLSYLVEEPTGRLVGGQCVQTHRLPRALLHGAVPLVVV